MERIMGLDVGGDRTIGVAISDPLLLTAQGGLKTIKRQNNQNDMESIKNIIEEYNINK